MHNLPPPRMPNHSTVILSVVSDVNDMFNGNLILQPKHLHLKFSHFNRHCRYFDNEVYKYTV